MWWMSEMLSEIVCERERNWGRKGRRVEGAGEESRNRTYLFIHRFRSVGPGRVEFLNL